MMARGSDQELFNLTTSVESLTFASCQKYCHYFASGGSSYNGVAGEEGTVSSLDLSQSDF